MKHLFPLLLLIFASCGELPPSSTISYSTDSDSTRYYYRRGWEQIMDEGNYGPAEQSYRKALQFDSNFLIGQSVLARLTTDLQERLELFEMLEAKKPEIEGDERRVLDVYIALTDFTNLREQQSERAAEALDEALNLAEQNFAEVVYRYPDEVYLKAEYVEVVHSLHGPRAALDTLAVIAMDAQRDNRFLLGFAASLEAELGNFEKALELARRLEQVQADTTLPKSYAVYADIYYQMDSLKLAKQYAARAVALDPRNLDASRLKTRIDARLQSEGL